MNQLQADQGSTLALLQTGILLVDNKSLALADNDLTILGAALDTGSNLHSGPLTVLAFVTGKSERNQNR